MTIRSMTGVRAALVIASVAWLVALLVFFEGLRPNLAHTLGHLLEADGATLPGLTTSVTMPVLGMGGWPVFGLVWAWLFGGPVVVALQALRLPADRLIRFTLAAVTLYLSGTGLVSVLFFGGLFLPFALL